MRSLKTREQVRHEFEQHGVNIAAFARAHALDETVVYQVLGGHRKGRRGEAHRAAVALGIKEGRASPFQVPGPSAPPSLRSVDDVRRQFDQSGMSVEKWARLHGFKDPTVVHKLLGGHSKGCRGEAKRAAVLLGLARW